jgi:hypothetical protein
MTEIDKLTPEELKELQNKYHNDKLDHIKKSLENFLTDHKNIILDYQKKRH